ncbi:MAG: hypothetical protein ABIJ48_00930 [Actinomycetota bacterium]
MKLEGWFGAETLRILRQIPGLTVTAEARTGDRRADALVGYAGGQARLVVETKKRANAATAWQLVHEGGRGAPVLLIAEETTAEARAILEDHGVAVIDGLGNAHIELPGLLFHLEGRRPRQHARPARLTGKAGVIAQVLLLGPQRDWRVQDLAKEADVAIGLAHRVLARLEAAGVVAIQGTGRNRVRRVANPTALLDLWAEETADRPTRTLAYLLAQTPQQLIRELGGRLERAGIDHALTGAAAGSLIAPFVTAVPVVEVWVAAGAAPEEVYAAVGADSVADGQNVVFLQGKDDTPLAFREQVDDLWVANRFRLYADLRRDPRRGREQADYLRQEVIGF